MRLYLDTNVVMDFLLGRHEPSSELVNDVMRCHHDVILSDHTLQELHRNDLDAHTFMLMLRACGKLHTCIATPNDRAEAKLIPTHNADALHAVLAARSGADVLVTNNVKDFQNVGISIRRPDDF